jgi:hypothetical protein
MVRRYAHFSAEHLAPYAERLCVLRLIDEPYGTNLSQQNPRTETDESNRLK